MNDKLKQFEGQSFLNLESFRRSGVGVQTVVWFVEYSGKLYVRTLENSGKVKRIRQRAAIRIVPCEVNGKPLGQWQPAQAKQILETEINKFVGKMLEEKYGVLQMRAFLAALSLRGSEYTLLEITLAD